MKKSNYFFIIMIAYSLNMYTSEESSPLETFVTKPPSCLSSNESLECQTIEVVEYVTYEATENQIIPNAQLQAKNSSSLLRHRVQRSYSAQNDDSSYDDCSSSLSSNDTSQNSSDTTPLNSAKSESLSVPYFAQSNFNNSSMTSSSFLTKRSESISPDSKSREFLEKMTPLLTQKQLDAHDHWSLFYKKQISPEKNQQLVANSMQEKKENKKTVSKENEKKILANQPKKLTHVESLWNVSATSKASSKQSLNDDTITISDDSLVETTSNSSQNNLILYITSRFRHNILRKKLKTKQLDAHQLSIDHEKIYAATTIQRFFKRQKKSGLKH